MLTLRLGSQAGGGVSPSSATYRDLGCVMQPLAANRTVTGRAQQRTVESVHWQAYRTKQSTQVQGSVATGASKGTFQAPAASTVLSAHSVCQRLHQADISDEICFLNATETTKLMCVPVHSRMCVAGSDQ